MGEIKKKVSDERLCEIAEMFLGGMRVGRIGIKIGVGHVAVTNRLRTIFIKIAQSEGVKLAQPINLSDIISVSDVWLAALRGYQARLKRAAA